MEYALVLYFDEDSENYINGIIKNISKDTQNDYMIINNIPPHLTLTLFKYNNGINYIIKIIENNLQIFSKEKINISSIGLFNPSVIFLSPVLNKKIIEMNIVINETLNKELGIKSDMYTFGEWVPHISLAVKLNNEQLNISLNTAIKYFKPFTCKINKITLAECNPYKEIKIWDIE
jgi:hypothetical protein